MAYPAYRNESGTTPDARWSAGKSEQGVGISSRAFGGKLTALDSGAVYARSNDAIIRAPTTIGVATAAMDYA